MDNNLKLAAMAVDKLLGNLAESDFVDAAGAAALRELRMYRLDMICDVFRTFAGRAVTEAEITAIVEGGASC